MPWIGAAASVVGGLLASSASSSAADQSSAAAREATQAQLQMFNTQNAQQAPYRQAGYNSLAEIMRGFGMPTTGIPYARSGGGTAGGMGMPTREQFTTPATPGELTYDWVNGNTFTGGNPGGFDQSGFDRALAAYNSQGSQPSGSGLPEGYFSHRFGAEDLNANMAPNWAFGLDQGIRAAKNAGNLQTGLLSGNTLKGISDYTIAKSGDLYQQAYNNYTANQSNIFNRLSNVAGLGSAANQQSAGLAGSLAPSIAGTIQNAGNAQAAGTMGAANALNGGASNALGWYTLNQINGGGGYTPTVQSPVPGQFNRDTYG